MRQSALRCGFFFPTAVTGLKAARNKFYIRLAVRLVWSLTVQSRGTATVDSFTFNKIAGSALAALLVIFGIRAITTELYPKGDLPKGKSEIVVVEVPEKAPAAVETKTAKEDAKEQPAKTEGQAIAAVSEGKGLPELLAAATIEGGQAVARRCVACHSFEKDGKNQVGPALYGVLGRDIAAVDGFAYSAALQGKEGVWDYQELDAFLANPREYAPGNKMAFAGLRRAEERADIILYLRSLSDNPLPLP
jgi:cytochrome c